MRPNHIYHVFPLGALRETDNDRNSKAYMNRANQRNIRELVGLIPHLQSLQADSILLGAYFQERNPRLQRDGHVPAGPPPRK